MAFTIISTNQTTSQYVAASGDTMILTDGASILVTSGVGISTATLINDINVAVSGKIVTSSSGIYLWGTSDTTQNGSGSHQVLISSTGSVQALHVAANAIYFVGTNNQAINHGSLISQGATIRINGDGGDVFNYGTITSSSSIGVWFDGIFGGSGGTADLTNSGIIHGATVGVKADTNDLTLINTGLIFGEHNGVALNQSVHELDLINEGVIQGLTFAAVIGGDGNDSIVNSGSILGDIQMKDGNDVYDGRGGSVTGRVEGGAGNDTYIVDDADIVLYELAGQGTDLVKAKVSFALADLFENLTLIGGDDINGVGNNVANQIIGNHGNNILRGKNGDDALAGSDGDDRLNGGAGGDALNGGNDDDVLRGGKGNDDLYGGGDNDVLIGGTGKDSLTGGGGEDVFRFVKANHSLDSGQADSILDFTSGEDLIDLGALPGNLAFIGSGAFSGAAEVRVSETGGGDSIVRVDVDGDGTADMKIKVLGVVGLDAADFLL